MEILRVHDNVKRRLVVAGRIEGDTFIKDIRKSSQKSYVKNAFGVDLGIVSTLRTKKITALIFVKKKGERLGITFADFIKFHTQGNIGRGPQYFIAEEFLDKLETKGE